jgi:hypothetical protein
MQIFAHVTNFYWLYIYHTTKYITSTPTNTDRKQRNNVRSQGTTNGSILEENKNKKKSLKSVSRLKTSSIMISTLIYHSFIASPSKRISTTAFQKTLHIHDH